MNRVPVLFLILALGLTGCVKTGEPTPSPSPDAAPAPATPAQAASPGQAAPPPPTPVEASPAANPAPDEPRSGRIAKPNWCQEDRDCSAGKVCESCQGEKCCVLGCHSNDQCSAGQKCKQVQCIRAPCPAQCE